MSTADPVKILIVDDLPDKLLVYRSILEEPGHDVITAGSGAEALRAVLKHDFAVVLLDVNMPAMDGFETAMLIRSRKRCAHTPIIFVTSHSDELHALRGYASGAVDYVLAPVLPEVLRTKVRVFVDLFRLNQQVREQAARQVAVAEREQAHLAALLERTADFVARVDAHGNVLEINRGGRVMLGYSEDQEVPGHLASYQTAAAAELMRTRGFPTAQREGVWFGESTFRKVTGEEVAVHQVVLAHSTPEGRLEHFSVVARDISESRRAAAAVRESEQRYRHLVHSLPAAVYTCDREGKITLYNEAAVALWGREPQPDTDRWSGAWRMYRPDGTPLSADTCPMTMALREGRAVQGEEIIIERPDGSRSNVLPHPEPIFDGAGHVIGGINMLVDITERKRAERALRESEGRLRAMLGQAAVGISLLDDRGRVLEVNERMSQIVGRSGEQLRTLSCEDLTHPEDWPAHRALLDELVAGRRTEFSIEKRYSRGDGSWVWVNVAMSPLPDEQGRVGKIVSVIEDVSARKRAEQEVQQHREHLEQLVLDRTAELEASHERLRLADRLASIGTLAAGLGHDMGNLLLPVSMRIDALSHLDLPAQACEDIRAIADSCEYLKRLSRGLRLFALNPEDKLAAGDRTNLTAWWSDVAPFLRNALPRGVQFEAAIPDQLPTIGISPHTLTQAVYNLVQNAGDALKNRPKGQVSLTASMAPDGRAIFIDVADNGPGMEDEVLRRCMEPFFTTKARGISTGFGLALVRNSVLAAGGTAEVRSRLGHGTTIRLTFPVKVQLGEDKAAPRPEPLVAACVDLKDPRMSAYVCSLLRSLGIAAMPERWSPRTQAMLMVIDDPGERVPELKQLLQTDPARRAVVFGDGSAKISEQIVSLGARPPAERVRTALQSTVVEVKPATTGSTR